MVKLVDLEEKKVELYIYINLIKFLTNIKQNKRF
jgi:hypothetical protein